MATEAQQILVVIVLAALFVFVNLKAGSNWLKFISIAGWLGSMMLAVWLLIKWTGI